MTIKVTLDEILEHEEFILVDWSISNVNIRIEQFFIPHILESKLKSIDKIKSILERNNTYTIRNVTNEIKRLQKLINNKLDRISSVKTYNKGGHRIERKPHIRPENSKLLYDIKRELSNVRRISERKELKINDKRYDILIDIVKLISIEGKLKTDFGYLMGKRGSDRSEKSDTDEKIVATLYWQSIFSNKTPTLLAQDSDFKNLLKIVTNEIGSKIFLPYNNDFREGITRNPFTLFDRQIRNGYYELVTAKDQFVYKNDFYIPKLASEKNQKVMEEINSLWQQWHYLSNYNTQPISPACLS